MNKTQQKRFNKIEGELSQLNQDLEDAQTKLTNCYKIRDFDEASKTLPLLSTIQHDIAIREVIKEEIQLPQKVCIEGGVKEIDDFMKDNNIVEDRKVFVEEYCSMYLLDNFDHTHYEFDFATKGNDIHITNIRWNENQLLKNDLKMLLKGKVDKVENGEVVLIKNTHFENIICLYDRREPNYQNLSLKETIKWLEKHYYL